MNTKHIDDMDIRRKVKRAARLIRRRGGSPRWLNKPISGRPPKRELRTLAAHIKAAS